MKSKDVKPDIANPFASEEHGEGMYKMARRWLIESGVLTDYEINDLILTTYVSDRSVKYTEVFLDEKSRKLIHNVYIGRWAYLLRSHKRIRDNILNNIQHLYKNSNFNYEMNIKLYNFDVEKS